MGWFRLFDRLRLRPVTEALEGWGLPSSALRLTDPHLASYFRGLITDSPAAPRADVFDIATHALARAAPVADGRFHVDIRATGGQSALLFGSDKRHAILSWHQSSGMALLSLPGQEVVELRKVDLLPLLGLHLPLLEIATLSAALPAPLAVAGLIEALAPWLTQDSRAVLRLPGAALAELMALLPSWPFQPIALLPCEPREDDPANNLPDVLLCLVGLSQQSSVQAKARAQAAERVVRATLWSAGSHDGADSGLSVTTIAESRLLASGLPVVLLGDAPPTVVGAALFGMQRTPLRGAAANALRFELQAASVFVQHNTRIAVPLVGPAVMDPDIAELPAEFADGGEIALHRNGPVREMEPRPAIMLGCAASRAEFVALIWPKLELAFDLIESEKIAPADIALLFPDGIDDWTRAAIASCGFPAASIRTACDGVLFRRLILAHPACDLTALRRSDLFDRFWRRINAFESNAASFTSLRSMRRVMLLSAQSRLLNAADIAGFARSRMYVVIDPSKADAAELAAVLRTARVVVAEPEVAIWAAIAPSAALGLLQSDTDPDIPYAAMEAASARGHQLMAMFGSAIGDDPQSSYVVAEDRFALLLDRLEATAFPSGEAV